MDITLRAPLQIHRKPILRTRTSKRTMVADANWADAFSDRCFERNRQGLVRHLAVLHKRHPVGDL